VHERLWDVCAEGEKGRYLVQMGVEVDLGHALEAVPLDTLDKRMRVRAEVDPRPRRVEVRERNDVGVVVADAPLAAAVAGRRPELGRAVELDLGGGRGRERVREDGTAGGGGVYAGCGDACKESAATVDQQATRGHVGVRWVR
jgi:hypothetical protein